MPPTGYAAVFCRIGPGWYLLLCVVTFTNFIASNWYWKNWGGSNILRELPKMGLCIFIFYAGALLIYSQLSPPLTLQPHHRLTFLLAISLPTLPCHSSHHYPQPKSCGRRQACGAPT